MESLDICLLGSPRIELNNAPVEFDTRKATALLAYLSVTQEQSSRDTLAALLWPDYDQTHARAALRRTLSTLNQALGPGGGTWLDIERETLSMRRDSGYTLDVSQFRQRLAVCRSHGHASTEVCPACTAPLEQAAALYRGDFLSGFTLRDSSTFDDWQFFQTEDLRHELQEVLEKLSCLNGTQGEYEKAIPYARRWLALDTLNETAHRQLILLYAWSGQRSAALRQYKECERILQQELDVSPLEETTQLYHSILEGKLPPAPSRTQPEPISVRMAEPDGLLKSKLHDHDFPLVGRSKEWEALLEAYGKVSQNGYLFLLKGEAGIGKTRLSEEFLAYAQAKGAATLQARCYEGEAGLTYGPLIDGLRAALARPDWQKRIKNIPEHWIREAARLLPELDGLYPILGQVHPIDGPTAGPGAQSRFFESLRQVLAGLCQGDPPGVIFLDDAQWADAASLDFLTYLGRRLKGFPCLLLISQRLEAAPSGEQLDRLSATVQRDSLGAEITLHRLNASDVDLLVRSLASTNPALPDQLDHRLQTEAEGLPFFVVEYLSAILQNLITGSPLDWSIPSSVRELLHSRLSTVSETGWQLLSTAAVIGRSFDLDILREASGRNETETLEALEGLVAQGFIREHSTDEGASDMDAGEIAAFLYDFSHEKLRAVVYEETSLARRRLLHRRVAEALINLGRTRLKAERLAGQIAHHYRSAGQTDQAAEYYRLAGEYARSLFANSEALTFFKNALELSHPDAAQINEAVGDLLTLQGEYTTALTSYETASAAYNLDGAARIAQKLGNVHDRRGEWDLAETSFQSALNELEKRGEAAQLARLYADWSLTVYNRGNPARSLDLVKKALQLAVTADEPYAQAQAYNILGILARSAGDFEQARVQLEQSLMFAERLGDAYIRSAALNNLALAYADQNDLERAIGLAKSALEISNRLGDRHREAALHNNLADFYYASGQRDEAMASLKKAVVIFAEIGLEAGSLSPEIWKLREW